MTKTCGKQQQKQRTLVQSTTKQKQTQSHTMSLVVLAFTIRENWRFVCACSECVHVCVCVCYIVVEQANDNINSYRVEIYLSQSLIRLYRTLVHTSLYYPFACFQINGHIAHTHTLFYTQPAVSAAFRCTLNFSGTSWSGQCCCCCCCCITWLAFKPI